MTVAQYQYDTDVSLARRRSALEERIPRLKHKPIAHRFTRSAIARIQTEQALRRRALKNWDHSVPPDQRSGLSEAHRLGRISF